MKKTILTLALLAAAATTASASGTAPHPRSAATPAPHAPAPDPAVPRRSGPDDASDHTASRRPAPAERLFVSEAVEAEIARVKAVLKVEKLAWMFENCFPNTLDTTVHYRTDEEGADDTFVYTGDIHAMWLRDSGAQVWPYVRYASQDEALRRMIAGVVDRKSVV